MSWNIGLILNNLEQRIDNLNLTQVLTNGDSAGGLPITDLDGLTNNGSITQNAGDIILNNSTSTSADAAIEINVDGVDSSYQLFPYNGSLTLSRYTTTPFTVDTALQFNGATGVINIGHLESATPVVNIMGSSGLGQVYDSIYNPVTGVNQNLEQVLTEGNDGSNLGINNLGFLNVGSDQVLSVNSTDIIIGNINSSNSNPSRVWASGGTGSVKGLVNDTVVNNPKLIGQLSLSVVDVSPFLTVVNDTVGIGNLCYFNVSNLWVSQDQNNSQNPYDVTVYLHDLLLTYDVTNSNSLSTSSLIYLSNSAGGAPSNPYGNALNIIGVSFTPLNNSIIYHYGTDTGTPIILKYSLFNNSISFPTIYLNIQTSANQDSTWSFKSIVLTGSIELFRSSAVTVNTTVGGP